MTLIKKGNPSYGFSVPIRIRAFVSFVVKGFGFPVSVISAYQW